MSGCEKCKLALRRLGRPARRRAVAGSFRRSRSSAMPTSPTTRSALVLLGSVSSRRRLSGRAVSTAISITGLWRTPVSRAEANDHGTPRQTPPATEDGSTPTRPSDSKASRTSTTPTRRRWRSWPPTIPTRASAARRRDGSPTPPCSRPSCATRATRRRATRARRVWSRSPSRRTSARRSPRSRRWRRSGGSASWPVAARASRFESVRRSAVEQVTDQKALGGIARHAADARHAAARDRAARPIRPSSKPSRRAANTPMPRWMRWIGSTTPSDDVLNGLVQRARDQGGAEARPRRSCARAKRPPVPWKRQPAVEYQGSRSAARARARRSDGGDWRGARHHARSAQTYAALRVAWVELLADAEVRPELVDRFEQLSDRVRERSAARRCRACRSRAARAGHRAREQAERAAVCADIEGLNGDDVLDRLAAARASWEGMPAMPEAWAAELQQRFDAAVPRG